MVRCGQDTLLRRPLSIHQRDGSRIALLFQVVGKGTDWLSHRQAGDKIDLLGPLGNGFSISPASQNLLLLAGGIGIAPLYFLAQEIIQKGIPVTLGIGMNTGVSLAPIHEMVMQLRGIPTRAKSTITIVPISEDGTLGTRGLVTSLLKDYVNDAYQIFACGPPGMYQTMAGMPELKDKPVQISLEIMMGCGVGVCYGCTVRTKRGLKQMCQDGPVFDLEDILWDKLS